MHRNLKILCKICRIIMMSFKSNRTTACSKNSLDSDNKIMLQDSNINDEPELDVIVNTTDNNTVVTSDDPKIDDTAEIDNTVINKEVNPTTDPKRKVDVDAPEVRHKTSVELTTGGYVAGFSIQGRSHIMMGTPCEDYHTFEDLGDGWLLAITSDGAGSAREAARGSKANCELAARLVKDLLDKLKWKENNYFPSELEWHIEIKNILEIMQAIIIRSAASKVGSYQKEQEDILQKLKEQEIEVTAPEAKAALAKKIEAQKEKMKTPLEARDFNATIILLLISPQGMLTAHIGDGRMGYLSKDGKWKSLMIPHKGDEASSTVFVPNNWNRQLEVPIFKMSNVLLPETRTIKEKPKAFVLMSDGCESFSWSCKTYDKEKNFYFDVNEPFEKFLNPLIESIGGIEDKEQRVNKMIDIINTGTEGGKRERDDRTMLLGVLD